MPRKKANNSVTPGASYTIDEDGCIVVTGTKLWKWRALDAELRASQTELELVSQSIQFEVAKNPELASLFQRKVALAGVISTARAELSNVQGEIEKDTGFSLKDCAFDDKTGRLYHLADDGGQGDPVKLRKPRGRKRPA